MPMFYGQIMIQNYLEMPGVSFCAVGDYNSDEAPLQVSEFGQGKEIDQLISKIYLEGGGGGGYTESYETAAYFYTEYVETPLSEMPFFFITGDEAFYEKIPAETVRKMTGRDPDYDVNSQEAWKNLMKRYNVFLIKKPYHNEKNELIIKKQWYSTIGKERVLEIETPKACIDVILGAIAITSGTRNLETYINDMEKRDQSQQRIIEVSKALKLYADMIEKREIIPVKSGSSSNTISTNYPNSNVKEVVNKLQGMDMLDDDNSKYLNSLKDMKKTFNDRIPNELLCPITEELFFDPVMTCDGQTYERKAIEYWLQSHDTSPVTNIKLQSKNLIPNLIIKKLVKEYFEKNSK